MPISPAISGVRSPDEPKPPSIYTIGHGSRPLDEFIGLLIHTGIACLVDVRAYPGSRRYPYFARTELAHSLPESRIDYVWEGTALGGRRKPRTDSPHAALRNASFRAYADHMQTTEFHDGVERLLQRAVTERIAVMCAERLPWQCHRFLIADYLVANGVQVLHIIDEKPPKAHQLHAVARVRGEDVIYDGKVQTELGLE